MTIAVAGKFMLLKIDFNGSGRYETLGGIKSRRLTLNNTAVDITNQSSEGNWREMLSGVASKSIEIAGDGLFAQGPASAAIIRAWLDQAAAGYNWQINLPGLGRFEGPFSVGQLEYSGDQETEFRFSISLSSSGPIAFTPDSTLTQVAA